MLEVLFELFEAKTTIKKKVCIVFDDVFFQPDWAGAYRGRWIGPGLLAGWSAGSWIVGAEVGSLQAMGVTLLCKNKKEGGSARASPVAALMPKSVSI